MSCVLNRMIQDLIAEANATKEAMDQACEGIDKAAKSSQSLSASSVPAATEEANLFGWGADSVPQAPIKLPTPDETRKEQAYTNGFAQHPATVQEEPVGGAETIAATSAPSQEAAAPQSINRSPVFTFNQSSANPGSYNGGGYHNRNISSASGFGEVMGGSADLQSLAESIDVLPSTPSMKEIDDLKSQSREADAVARDAESSHRQLIAQMEELRRLADEAESKSRSLSDKPIKKKGLLRKGKKPDVVRLAQSNFYDFSHNSLCDT